MSGTISLLQQLLPIEEVRIMTGDRDPRGYELNEGLHLYLGQDYLS